MYAQRVERIAKFMGDAHRKKGQQLNPLAFDGGDSLLAGFGGVMDDHGNADRFLAFTGEWNSQQPEQPRARILNLEFEPENTRPFVFDESDDLVPFEVRQDLSGRLARGGVRLDSEQTSCSLVQVGDTPVGIDHQHAIFDRMQQRFEKVTFPRKALDDLLQTVCVKACDPAEDFVEKTGLASGCHVARLRLPRQNQFLRLKNQ